jgi:sec-independent protein translocase protein TatC
MSENESGPAETLIGHLLELRSRLMKSVICYAIAFIALIPFAEKLYSYTAQPLLQHLPKGGQLISTEIAGTFLVPMKLVLFLALLVTAPIILYQLWAFVAPGLYKHEKRYARPLLIASTLLFYAGCAFIYFILLPVMFKWFTSISIAGVAYMPDIAHYLDFVLLLTASGGISFQVPIAVIIAVILGWITPAQLSEARGYVIVAIFIIAAALTPPDGLSLIMMAIPMCLLYEIGVLFARLMNVGKSKEKTA